MALVNKWCTVAGLSTRPELNDSAVYTISFDEPRGRYKVQLSSGHQLSLKSDNLALAPDQPAPPVIKNPNQPPPSAGTKATSAQDSIPWQTILLVALGAWWVYNSMNPGSGGGGGAPPSEAYSAEDIGYMQGHIREVTTLAQFNSAVTQHKEDTGLPVVVDFFSHSCGPCRMIEPSFKALAAEFAGQAVFLKVDVNANHNTAAQCGVRSMPTFQFYLNGRMVNQFAGADQRRLRRDTETVVQQSEQHGPTCAGKQVTEAVMEDFYTTHPAGKEASAAGIAAKYKGKCAKLLRLLSKKYGEAPVAVALQQAPLEDEMEGVEPAPAGSKTATLTSVPEEQLRAELIRRYEESTAASFISEPVSAETVHKLVVVGGGPAGLAAALYGARAGLAPVIVAPQIGGQLLGKGVDVENYPGVAASTGRGIIAEMRHQASTLFNTSMIDDMVTSVDLTKRPFLVKLNHSDVVLRAHTLVIAAGADSRWLGVTGELQYRGGGVSSCATCDGFLFRGLPVAVVGGGDTAMEEALVLARTSPSVTVIHRRTEFRASKILSDRVLSHPKIKVLWETTVQAFEGKQEGELHQLTGLQLQGPGGTSKLAVGAAFVAIGHDPNTSVFKGKLDMDAQGYLQVAGRSSRTSVEGVYAAGDVADKVYRQAITSAGTGAMAALDAERWLSEQGTSH